MNDFFKGLMGAIGAILLIFLFIIMISGLTFGWRWVAAPFVGQLEKRETVQSGDFRMYSYDHFYDLCAAIQRNQRTLMAQKQTLKNAEGGYEQRVRQNIVGLKSQLQSKISTYNQDARKEETMGKFRANDLPARITYEEGEVTECE